MNDYPSQLLNATAEFWGPRTGRPLTPEDARQIVENITGFFGVLERWDAVGQNVPHQRVAPTLALAEASSNLSTLPADPDAVKLEDHGFPNGRLHTVPVMKSVEERPCPENSLRHQTPR